MQAVETMTFSTSTWILTGTTVAMEKHRCSIMSKNRNGNATFFYMGSPVWVGIIDQSAARTCSITHPTR